MVISAQSSSSAPRAHVRPTIASGSYWKAWTHGFWLGWVPNKQKKSQKQPPDNTNKQVCSYSGDAGGGEEKKGRRCQEKGNKFLNKLNYTLNPPRPPLPRRSTFLALSFHFAASLFLPPPTHTHTPILSVSLCLSLDEQTGRDREIVVVLAVWHYQLINPCQQLVCLPPPPFHPPSLPSSTCEGVEELTDLPARVWLAQPHRHINTPHLGNR